MKVTGFPKATYYYWVNCFERVNKDELIEKEMLKIRQEHANAGYRPMSELLKQRGYHHVNHKKVQRLMKKLGLRVTSYSELPFLIKKSQQIRQNSNIMKMEFRKSVISILTLIYLIAR